MSTVKAWSFSAWAQYDLCPLWYFLEKVKKLGKFDTPAMQRGNQFHKELAAYVTGAPLDPQKCMLKEVHPSVQYVVEELRAFPQDRKLVEQQWGFTSRWTPTGWFAGDTWYRAILDVAVLYDDMTGEAVDWKTGRRYDDNDEQMELFGATFLAKYPPAQAVHTRLVYVDSGEEVERDYTRTQLGDILSKWDKKVAPMFRDEIFAPKPNHRCGKCPFGQGGSKHCKYG